MIRRIGDGWVGRYRYVAFAVTWDEIEKRLPLARERVEEIKLVLGGDEDYYLPGVEEVAAEMVLREALATVPDAPADPQAAEEPGYGLPEYSLYDNYDARSWRGRWYWSVTRPDIDYALTVSDEESEQLNKLIEELEERAREEGATLLLAVWMP